MIGLEQKKTLREEFDIMVASAHTMGRIAHEIENEHHDQAYEIFVLIGGVITFDAQLEEIIKNG